LIKEAGEGVSKRDTALEVNEPVAVGAEVM
jgi:hypothetical protein